MKYMTILKKFTSRKFWMALAGLATGVAMALGANSGDVQTVAGAVTAVVSVVTYVMAEGKIDAASVAGAVEGVQDAIGAVASEDGDAQ